MKLMKIRALRGFGLGGGRFLDVGNIGELPETEALLRVRQGKAELVLEMQHYASEQIEKIKPNGGKKK